MAGIKISELDAGVPQLTDIVPASDMVDTPPTTKKYTQADLALFYRSYIAPSVQRFAFNFADSGGTNDAFTVDLTPQVTELVDGLLVVLNTGSLQNTLPNPTLSVNGLPPVTIRIWSGALLPNDMTSQDNYLLVYDEAQNNFQLINPSMSTANSSGVQTGFYVTFAGITGTPNNYSGNLTPAYDGSPLTGMMVCMIPDADNTDEVTLTLGLETNPVYTWDGDELSGGEILSGRACWLWFDEASDSWRVLNPAVINSLKVGNLTLSGDTITSDTGEVNIPDLKGYVQSVDGVANQVSVDNSDSQNPVVGLPPEVNVPGTLTIQNTVALNAIIDDDTMATATDSNVPTAESVVQYIGAQAASPLKDVKVYTSSTTWTKPAGMGDDDFIIVEGVGGGGGSGGIQATGPSGTAVGGPGSGGGYFWKKIMGSALASSVTVTVGVGGTAAAAGSNPGGAGGTTSFGAHSTATGGLGGLAGAATTTTALASAPSQPGGTASGGDINTPGGTGIGGRAQAFSVPVIVLSVGGDSALAPGVQGGGEYRNGKFPGGGASAPVASFNQAARVGGTGAGGLIKVWEYYR